MITRQVNKNELKNYINHEWLEKTYVWPIALSIEHGPVFPSLSCPKLDSRHRAKIQRGPLVTT